MQNKGMNLFISFSNFPVVLEIFLANGFVIYRKNIYANSVCLSFCDMPKEIFVKVKFQNSTIIKYIKFSKCQNKNLSLNFKFQQNQITLNTFLLYDRNYNFPISNAILKFENS